MAACLIMVPARPLAMPPVLARQRLKGCARKVGDREVGVEIDALPQHHETPVELRILVVGETLVIAAELEKHVTAEGSVMAVLDQPRLCLALL